MEESTASQRKPHVKKAPEYRAEQGSPAEKSQEEMQEPEGVEERESAALRWRSAAASPGKVVATAEERRRAARTRKFCSIAPG